MIPMRRTMAVLLALSALTATAAADVAKRLYQSHFADVAGGTPCYARAYTAEHLKTHPEQRVAKIIVDMDKANPDGVPIDEENLVLGFGVQIKTSPEWYTNSAICKSAGAEINCFLEGDGGSFTITADAGGAIRIATGSYGIAMEGMKDFIELPADKGDDHVFIIPLAPQADCDAATADVSGTDDTEKK
jgi:hypothetical protein